MSERSKGTLARVEWLERRRMLSASLAVVSLRDASRRAGSEAEAVVAISRATGSKPAGAEVFVAANVEPVSGDETNTATASVLSGSVLSGSVLSGLMMGGVAGLREERDEERDGGRLESSGLLVSASSDSGDSYAARLAATDVSADKLEPACCDPSVARDEFGNLFFTYLSDTSSGGHAVPLYVSTDNGQNWKLVKRWGGAVDQPTVTAGNGVVAVTFASGDFVVSASARVVGAGASGVGKFGPLRRVPGTTGNFGDIAIGPSGQVAVVYTHDIDPEQTELYLAVDRDGPGPLGFDRAVRVARVNIGSFTKVPPQEDRAIDPEVSLEWDRSGGPATGRLYVTYTDRTNPDGTGDGTKIVARISDDGGSSFGSEIRLDDGPDSASKILPQSALDQSTGALITGWHDGRFDTGSGADSTNDVANDDVAYVATVAMPTATSLAVSPNVRVTPGVSNGSAGGSGVELGDYTGLDAADGIALAAFADNSNSTGDNPDGSVHDQDIYVARLQVTADVPAGTAGSFRADGLSSLVQGTARAIRGGKSAVITVTLKDAAGFDVSRLGSITISDDSGKVLPVTVTRRNVSSDLRSATIALRVTGEGGSGFSVSDNGSYRLVLGDLTDRLGQVTAMRLMGVVTVAVPVPQVKGENAGVFAARVESPAAIDAVRSSGERVGLFGTRSVLDAESAGELF